MRMPPKLYGGVRLTMDGPCMQNVRRLDMGAVPMIAEMQANGLFVDVGKLREFGTWLAGDMKRIEREAAELTGVKFNMGSTDQLNRVLFQHLGLKPRHELKLTKGGKIQLDDKALETMGSLHPVIGMVQDYRERDKLKGTYVDGLIPHVRVGPTGADMLYPNYKITTVETGRLAAEDPNVMGIPVRSPLGRRIREAFYAPPGWIMYTVDMSQIEIRYMAWWANVRSMIATFNRDGDIHTETSARLFFKMKDGDLNEAYRRLAKPNASAAFKKWKNAGKEDKAKLLQALLDYLKPESAAGQFVQAMQPERRTPAKNLGLGVMYAITAIGLLEQLHKIGIHDWTETDCEGLITAWFAEYEEVLIDRQEQIRRVRQYGFNWDAFGRVRFIPELKSVHKWIQSRGARAAGNLPVQSGAQGLMKLVMAEARDLSEWLFGDENKWLLQIHDELVGMCRIPIVEDVVDMIQNVMAGCCPPMSEVVAIKSGGVWGPRWSDLEK